MATRSSKMKSSESGIIILGNAGSGKSFICNLLIGYDRFKANFQPKAVTTETEHHLITIERNSFRIYNIPGLIEAEQESIDRNKKEIVKAFDQSPTSVVIFVWTQNGGRVQNDDVIAFKALNDAYKFPPGSLMFVVNNIPQKRPSEYEGDFLTTLAHLLQPIQVSAEDTFFIDTLDPEEKEKINETCLRFYSFIDQHHASLQHKHADIIVQSDQLNQMREELKKQQQEAKKDRVAFQNKLTQTIKEHKSAQRKSDQKYKALQEKYDALTKAGNDRQEPEENVEKPAERYLTCKGRACSTCNGCRDWHRIDSHWALVDGGTCNASRAFIYLHWPDLCHCKDYYWTD